MNLTKATSFAEELLRSIESGEGEHEWAQDNRKGDKLITCALKDVRSDLTDFHKQWMLTKNINDLRKKCSPEQLIIELTAFNKISDKVTQLEIICNKVVRASETLSA
jgi:hypothetical protein